MSVRTSFAADRIATGEYDVFQYSGGPGRPDKGIVFCHGSGQTPDQFISALKTMYFQTHRFAVSIAGEIGGQTWGSDLVVTRIGQAIAFLQTQGVTGPVALVGASMGTCSALNYAYRYPENVASVSCVIGLVDLENAYANPYLVGRRPEMEDIYGDPPDFSGHNPVDFAADMDPDLPIHIWGASDDVLVPPATHAEFIANRPQTGYTDLGPVGHTQVAWENSLPEMVPFMHESLGGGWA